MSVTSDAPTDPRRELPWPDEPRDTPPVQRPTAAAAAPPVAPARQPAPRPPAAAGGIGRLRRVDPTELWQADAFATWLAANLDEIGPLLGTRLADGTADPEVPGTIAATNADGPVRVIVELGPTSDEALGRLMRQVVASGTRTAIWVCSQASPEHLASVGWLNREISGRLHVVTVEAVRIDDSVAAPIFRAALRAEPHRAEPT